MPPRSTANPPRPRGRPPGRNFDFLLRLRVQTEWWDAVKAQAERCGESPSSYIRIAVSHRMKADTLRREQRGEA